MLIARLNDGTRAEATPGARATCPACQGLVYAKCGSIVTWHWAHDVHVDCDWEPETEWHRRWKGRFPLEWREVPMDGKRADVRLPGGLVLEFQHSTISVEDIQARERHYKTMVWIVDAAPFSENFDIRDHGSYCSFRWYWPRKSWWAAKRPLLLDFGDALFHVQKLHHDVPCGGWGELGSRRELLSEFGP
jgi:competence protein CoiA